MNNAFEPKTDRELLIMINEHVTELNSNVHEIKEKISQKTDIDFCDRQHVVIEKRLTNHSDRIVNLERWQWGIIGIISFITFVAGLALLFIKK